MQFPQPLERGVLVQRYKRFFADVAMDDGRHITAHCPNPGSMLGLNLAGMPVWLSRSDNPKRKLAHTLELVGVEGGHVGVNALWANKLASEALAAGVVSELAGYPVVRPEVKYGEASRVDFLLTGSGRPDCYVEVKSVTLCRGERLAEWPDSVSSRGARHLVELEAMVAAGNRAALLFVVQRNDCDRFDLAHDLDSAFSRALAGAMAAGVEVLVYGCDIDPVQVRISRRLPHENRALT